MVVTEQQLVHIFPTAQGVLGQFVDELNAAMQAYQINTPARSAAFIAQVGFESAHFSHLVEGLCYSTERLASLWPNRFCGPDGKPNALAMQLGGKPEAIADSVYANRLGNGPPESGDGWRFRGRGLIQLTGRTNYQQAGAALKVDFEANPELLQEPRYACLSAAWFWSVHELNALADAGDFKSITLRINGGLNGYDLRAGIWQEAREVIA